MRIPVAIVGHATSRRELQAFVDATTLIDVAQRESGSYGPLYTSGIRYRAEQRRGAFPGVERFQTLSSAYAVGFDDCDGLASARASELLAQGIPARAWAVRSPGIGWHVITLWWDDQGTMHVEDPSARLGMLDRESTMEETESSIVGVRIERGATVVVGVGACVGGVTLAAVGRADADDPSPASQRRARLRAARRALGRLANDAARVAIGPQTMLSSAARAAVATVVRDARRADADLSTMDTLGVDDQAEADDVSGLDPLAWRLYART